MNNIVKTALLLAVVLSVTAFAVGTLSEDSDAAYYTPEGEGYTLTYTTSNGEVTITDFTSDSSFDGTLVLDTIDGNPVVAIGTYAFYQAPITTIVLPDTLRTIEEAAFGEADITQLIVPNSVTSIGNGAFVACDQLDLLIIGDGVETLDATILNNGYDSKRPDLIYLSPTDNVETKNSLMGVYQSHKSLLHLRYVPDAWVEDFSPLFSTSIDSKMTFTLNSTVAGLLSTEDRKITYEWTRMDGTVTNGTGILNSASPTTTLEIQDKDVYTLTLTIDLGDGQKLSFSETYNADQNRSIVKFMNGSQVHKQTAVTNGTTITAPEGPTSPGLEFVGWYDESTDQPFNFNTSVSSDLTLYAKYSITSFEAGISVYNSATASGFQGVVTEHSQISYTYAWTADGVEDVTGKLLLRPDISLQYTLTVTATYDGDTKTATAKTVPVQTNAPVDSLGGEVRVFFGSAIGSLNDFRFSGSDSTIYLPEGSYEVWYHQEGYTCPHEEITVTKGATNSVELKVEEAPEVDPAPEPEPEEPGIDVPPWAWDDDDDYVPPIVPSQTEDSGDDDTVTIVACAAAAVVAALMAAFLILDRRH